MAIVRPSRRSDPRLHCLLCFLACLARRASPIPGCMRCLLGSTGPMGSGYRCHSSGTESKADSHPLCDVDSSVDTIIVCTPRRGARSTSGRQEDTWNKGRGIYRGDALLHAIKPGCHHNHHLPQLAVRTEGTSEMEGQAQTTWNIDTCSECHMATIDRITAWHSTSTVDQRR